MSEIEPLRTDAEFLAIYKANGFSMYSTKETDEKLRSLADSSEDIQEPKKQTMKALKVLVLVAILGYSIYILFN